MAVKDCDWNVKCSGERALQSRRDKMKKDITIEPSVWERMQSY